MHGNSCKSTLATLILFPREVDDLPLHSPDRWDNLPEAVKSLPGIYANTLTFSAGPRVRYFSYILCDYFDKRITLQACIGQRFSLIEMKTFLYVLITNFVFSEADETVVKANVCVNTAFILFSLARGRPGLKTH